MSTIPSIKLSSGHEIPSIGLGVYKTPASVAEEISYTCLKLGYRHIDSAELYKNELEVATAIAKWVKEDPVNNKREDVFYTTKVWDAYHGYEETKKAIETSLKNAEAIGYIDLLLLHSPNSDYEKRHGSWMAFQEAVDSGKVKSIGVSNFGVKHLKELLSYPDLKYRPAVNQVEIHPWLMRTEIAEYCKRENIVIEAYSPLAKARKFDDKDLLEIAEKYQKSPAQILIRWSIEKGYVVLPKTVSESRAISNKDVFDFKLSEEDVKKLEKPNDYFITGWDPTTYPLDNEK